MYPQQAGRATTPSGSQPRVKSNRDHEICLQNGQLDETATGIESSGNTCRPDTQAQNEEIWIVELKAYLSGATMELTGSQAKACAKIADN